MANFRIKAHSTLTHRYYTPWEQNDFVTQIGRLTGVTEEGRHFLARAKDYCRMERAIIARLSRGKAIAKPNLMREFGFPGRMVNTTIIHAKGAIDSARECAILNLEDATEAIGRKLADYWAASEDPECQGELPGRRAHLEKLIAREASAERAIDHPSIFPGRTAYEDQTKPHWKADYEALRSNHIGCVGSSDEACGNSTLQLTLGEAVLTSDGHLRQTCRLSHGGKLLGRVRFRVDDTEELLQILQANGVQKVLVEEDAWLDEKGKLIHPVTVESLKKKGIAPVATRKILRAKKEGRTALNVMLHRHEDGRWYLHASYSKKNKIVPYDPSGWMGIDLNADSLAHACLGPQQELLTYGKAYFDPNAPAGSKATQLYKAINALVTEAKERNFGIALEFLEFEGAKRWLRTKLGQILRIFPYRKIRAIFERRCREMGVLLRYVPPAYTSALGALFAQKWPELGRDQAACVTIAARATAEGCKWLEKLSEAAVAAERLALRINAKGWFGHNVTVVQTPSPIASSSGRQSDSPFRWQICCGRKIVGVTKTLTADYRSRVLDVHRAAVAQGRAGPPRPKIPSTIRVGHDGVSPSAMINFAQGGIERRVPHPVPRK